MSDQIQDTYEIRPLYEACPKEWRDRIPELAERYKKLYHYRDFIFVVNVSNQETLKL